ncbi:hypothetical protein SLE2022_068040 [Rubroshorea leprosula]
MDAAENREVVRKDDVKEAEAGPGKILWLFPRLRFSKQEPKKPEAEVKDKVKTQKNPPPARVFFGSRQNPPPPLDMEAEESIGRTSNPVVLWQVYVISGFLILKWVWTRWKERKEGGDKKDSSDDDQSPADEEYSQTE